MSELPKKKRKTPNVAAAALDSEQPTGAKYDLWYFENRYEECMKHSEIALNEENNRSQARAWKARALECALYLATAYTISDGEKAKIWHGRVERLQASVHRNPPAKLLH